MARTKAQPLQKPTKKSGKKEAAPSLSIVTTRPKMAMAFNEWMRRYIEEPERFKAEMVVIKAFMASEKVGKEDDYGSDCALYLTKLIDELS